MKIDLHLYKLRDFALQNRDLPGKFNIVAGLFRGNNLFGMAQNSSIHLHAESHLLKKPCLLRT